MKEKKRRGTVIFFPGWPATLGLLDKFFLCLGMEYKKVIVFDKKLKEDDLYGMDDPIIGVSYSAGAIDMNKFVSKCPEKFSAIRMISPTGTREVSPKLREGCFLFFIEMVKLVFQGEERIFWEIFKEVFRLAWKDRKKLRCKIEEMRQFRLYEEIIMLYHRVDFAFIFSARDSLLPLEKPPYFIRERFIKEDDSCGHFGFLEKPEYYWKLFQDL